MLRRAMVAAGALAFTVALFLVLPVLEGLGETPQADLSLVQMDTANLPPPPPPPPDEEEPEEESEAEDEPPELTESAPPLDLSQLEVALSGTTGPGDGWFSGDFAVKLDAIASTGSNANAVDALFSLADLDQKPRVVHQPSPVLDAQARKKTPGTVHVVFVVDPEGRVEDPLVQRSSDPAFERPALAAVKQWRFEPGKRKGQAVRFRMRVPITFPQGG
jgi:periplasmic protein TonB